MAYPQKLDISLNSLISSTLQAYLPELEINVIRSAPMSKMLLEEKVRKMTGGTYINTQLLYGFNSNTGFYGFGDSFALTSQETMTAAQYKFANLQSSIVVFGEERHANMGDPAIQDLVQSKVTQTELSLARQLNQSCYGDPSQFFGAAPDGLGNLIYATATPADPPSGAAGGISVLTFPWWMNNANTAPGAYATNGAGGTSATDYVRRMTDACTDGGIRPTFVMNALGVWESHQKNANIAYRILPNQSADLGFQTVMQDGIPMAWDRDCPDTYQYFINTKFLRGVVSTSRWFAPTPWIPKPDQDAEVMRVHCRFGIECSNRMLQGVIANWS